MKHVLAISLVVAALAFALSPLLTPGFNGFEPDQFPVPQVDPPGQPAGYAFAIWGVIYLWLIVGTAFQAFARRDAADWHPIRIPLLASLLLGVPWLAVAQASPIWAAVLIWAMTLTALAALIRAPQRDGWFGHGPTGLYAGWLTAAASVSLALLTAGYGLLSATAAALAALTLALVIAAIVTLKRPDAPTYPAAVVWALIGVMVANWPDGPTSVKALAITGALALTALSVSRLRVKDRRRRPA